MQERTKQSLKCFIKGATFESGIEERFFIYIYNLMDAPFAKKKKRNEKSVFQAVFHNQFFHSYDLMPCARSLERIAQALRNGQSVNTSHCTHTLARAGGCDGASAFWKTSSQLLRHNQFFVFIILFQIILFQTRTRCRRAHLPRIPHL